MAKSSVKCEDYVRLLHNDGRRVVGYWMVDVCRSVKYEDYERLLHSEGR